MQHDIEVEAFIATLISKKKLKSLCFVILQIGFTAWHVKRT